MMCMRKFGGLLGALAVASATLSTPVFAGPATDVQALQLLNQTFTDRLAQGRNQVYLDWINNPTPAQAVLNADPGIELQYMDERGMPVAYITHNLNAARTISTDMVWPGGGGGFTLDGAGTVLGQMAVWDAGAVLVAHQEFGGRATQLDGAVTTHFHATHVAGTMAASGFNGSAVGMSYAAEIGCYDWSNDEGEMATAGANGLNVSNHSYGSATGWRFSSPDWYWWGDTDVSTVEDYRFGFYDNGARDWDEIVYNAPYYLPCKSAGNDRNDFGPGTGGTHLVWNGAAWVSDTTTREWDGGTDGFDCISTKGVAKNILTVGAVNDLSGGWSAPNFVSPTNFTSWGPADDGRIKPDIVANGASLFSTNDAGVSSYTTLSGTSMSSPNASGSTNLLFRYYEDTHDAVTPLASTMKGLVIHTANEAGTADGPDYRFGWGLMSTLNASELLRADSGGVGHIREDSLPDGESVDYAITSDGTGPIKVTLAWTDPPGTPVAPQVNPTDPMLVHDLDLRVSLSGSGVDHEPWILNPAIPTDPATTGDNAVDNVEQVVIDNPSAGTYVVLVTHKGSLSATQHFSLIASHAMEEYVCPITLSGDINDDGNLTSADLINLVNYAFKSGAPPLPCEANGDVDCSGTVTSADLIFLVNYIFKSGVAPCDICTMIPAEWSCP